MSDLINNSNPAKRSCSHVLGIPVDRATLSEAINAAMSAIQKKTGPYIFSCANPHSLVVSRNDPAFAKALNNSDLVVSDGSGLSIMAKLCRIPIGPRITGSDFSHELMSALNEKGGGKVFFFGSSDKVLGLIETNISYEFPNLTICGTLSPPFGDWDEDTNSQLIDKINHASPDILWVGMTAPKQEKWVNDNSGRLDASVIGSIGAVFDFIAGTYPRAPKLICDLGLEWAYRLYKEPQRMWQRNFVSTPKFLLLMLWHHFLIRRP